LSERAFAPSAEQRRLVELLAAFGISQREIAGLIGPAGIGTATLRRHFREELRNGRAKATAAVIDSLHRHACRGNVAACKLWLEWHARGAAAGEAGAQDVLASLVAGARARLERKLDRLAGRLAAAPLPPPPR
jgi:hypothetical protein